VLGAAGAVSGTSATITFTLYKDSTLATVVAIATPVTLTIGGAVAKTVLSTDAASYSALAPVVVTTTSTDSAGNAAYDQAVTTVGTIVSSIQLGGTLASPAYILGGVGTKKGAYAPGASYPTVTISGTDSTSSANAISATFAVVSPTDVTASAATDAANAATDAANAAADAADAATAAAQDTSAQAQAALAAVNALSAKITVLAAQIAKIIKKLKA
jgi:hypothetical protein